MAPARHELIGLDEPDEWAAALATVPHGHAHTWGWARAVALTSGRPTWLYRYRRDGRTVVCVLAGREEHGHVDVLTPYGFGGFAPDGPLEDFPADWRGFALARGWVSGYVALNPLLAGPAGFAAEEVHVHNSLHVMDLKGSEDEIRGRLSRNRRRQLEDWPAASRALRRDREELAAFLVAESPGFFARRGAGSATDLRRGTVEAIAALDDVLLVGAGRERLEVVAAFGHTPHTADALFNVSLPGGERHTAHLIWAAVQWLRALGVPSLNLGGGIEPGDGVADFKRRFGGAELPLVSLRQVYRPREYEALCRAAGVSPSERSGYFPAYRA